MALIETAVACVKSDKCISRHLGGPLARDPNDDARSGLKLNAAFERR